MKKESNANKLPLKLSRPAHRALQHAGIGTLKQLSRFSEKEIAGLHGIGPTAIREIKKAFQEKGLAFTRD